MTTPESQLIDTHAHIVPPSLVAEARTSGKSLGVTVEDTDRGPALQFDGLVPLRPLGGLAQVEPRLAWMAEQGLDLQILASWLDIHGYTLSPDNAATWARLFNEHLAELIASHEGTFRGLATVPIQDGTMAAKELEYAVKELGMLGTMVSADPGGGGKPRRAGGASPRYPRVRRRHNAQLPDFQLGAHPGHHHNRGKADPGRPVRSPSPTEDGAGPRRRVPPLPSRPHRQRIPYRFGTPR